MMNLDWDAGGADTETLVTDTRFPQIREVRNSIIALARLAALADGATRVQLLNLWYIPGKSLRAVYRLEQGAAARDGQIWLLQFYAEGESAGAHAGAAARAADPARVHHLPGWDAVAWHFPEDPGLPRLPSLVESASLRQRMAAVTDVAVPLSAAWRLLSYLPGERCTLRIDSGDASVVAKLSDPATAAASHALSTRLWGLPGRRFILPRPLALEAREGVRWEAFVPGHQIESGFASGDLGGLARRVAPALTALHATPGAGLPDKGREQLLSRLRSKVLPRIMGAVAPAVPEAEALIADLEVAARALPPEAADGLIHGDFHVANLLADGGDIIFLDLDSAGRGSPARDLAHFGGRLLLMALVRGERLGDAARAARELVDAYRASGGNAVSEDEFAWYMAALLLAAQARTCIRHLAPGLQRLVPALLGIARRTLAQGRFDSSAVG
ncbi:MAG TPA: aminoglycoside phosphotransferase family protein [Burkholderiales bacterium]|nr:aminoglycoside phosphotransferase family protein [Burkholderiales bacterium]